MDLPVGLTGDVDVVKVSGVVGGVSSSQKQLATRLSVRVPEVEPGRSFNNSGDLQLHSPNKEQKEEALMEGTSPAVLSPVQVEGEDVLLHLLLAHDVVKDGRDPVHRDARVGHAEDAVKLGCNESDPRLLDGFCKQLIFHNQVGNLDRQTLLMAALRP